MKPSNRVLIAGIAIELLLAALGLLLLFQLKSGGMTAATSPEDVASTIMSVLGTAMGALGGVLVAIFLVLRKRGQ